jgi:hypothetical protein
MDLDDAGRPARYVIRDREGKFPALFDAILADAGTSTTKNRTVVLVERSWKSSGPPPSAPRVPGETAGDDPRTDTIPRRSTSGHPERH